MNHHRDDPEERTAPPLFEHLERINAHNKEIQELKAHLEKMVAELWGAPPQEVDESREVAKTKHSDALMEQYRTALNRQNELLRVCFRELDRLGRLFQ